MGHLALGHQVAQEPELFVGRHQGVDPVQLEQLDPFEAESAQAELALLTEVFGPANREPLAGALSGQSGLRGDDQAVRVRVQGLENETLAHLGTVGVGRVDEIDPHIDSSPQNPDALVAIGRLAPDPASGDLHCAVTEAMDGGGTGRATAQAERAARTDRLGTAGG